MAFVFLAAWGTIGALAILLLGAIEQHTGLQIPAALHGAAVVSAAVLAAGATLALDCAVFVALPFANPWCQALGF